MYVEEETPEIENQEKVNNKQQELIPVFLSTTGAKSFSYYIICFMVVEIIMIAQGTASFEINHKSEEQLKEVILAAGA